jgi:hypothetical protein
LPVTFNPPLLFVDGSLDILFTVALLHFACVEFRSGMLACRIS